MPNPKTEDIVKALQAQKTVKDIVEELGVPCRTVYRIKDRLKTRGTTKRKTGSGRPLSVVTSGFIEKIKQRVKRNPVRTMRGMARELGVNEKSVRKAVKLLGARSLARTKRFLLTESLKASRLARAKKILSMLKKNLLLSCSRMRSILLSTQCPTHAMTVSYQTCMSQTYPPRSGFPLR
jgi:transposase